MKKLRLKKETVRALQLADLSGFVGADPIRDDSADSWCARCYNSGVAGYGPCLPPPA